MSKRVYEAPVLIGSGRFAAVTGLLGHRGRDRLILNKHFRPRQGNVAA